MHNSPDPIWVTDLPSLQACAEACTAAPWVALDSESNSMHVYRERVCLVQINAGGSLYLIDPFELGPAAPPTLAPLKPILEDSDHRCLLHGGEYDVACFKRDFDISITGIFDTQMAAMCLGHKRTGYGALVQEYCDTELPKGHSQYDWGTRPLSEEAVRYALDDVIYLPRVAEAIEEKIRAADLEEELALFNQAVEDTRAHHGGDELSFMRVKGAHRLPPAKRLVLQHLYEWRDSQAAERDVPPGRVINNDCLLQLATVSPTNFGSLKRIRMRGWQLRELGDDLLGVIKTAKGADPASLPALPEKEVPSDEELAREKRLKSWRRSMAEKRELPEQVVLPAKALGHLRRNPPQTLVDLADVPLLGAKRIERDGQRLLELCRAD